MSVRIIDSGNRLDRTANVVQGSSDFTVMFWYRPVTILTGNYTLFVTQNGTLGTNTYTKWAGFFGDSSDYELSLDSGGSGQSADYFNQAITADIWKHLCYVRSGTSHTFYLNGLPVQNGTVTLDLSAAAFIGTLLGDDGTADGNTHEFSNYREWNVALNQVQVNAEMASTSAVVSTAGLVAFTPLTSDGTDHSGNGNNWTTVGSVSFVSDPVFPANFCPNTAKQLGNGASDSATMTTANGVCSLFYSYIPLTIDAAFSALATGTSGFAPLSIVFSPTLVQLNGVTGNGSVYISVESSFVGNRIVTEVIPNGTLTSPMSTFAPASFQNSTVPAGSPAIPTTSEMGDGVALPLALLSASTGDDTLALIGGVPHGTGFSHSEVAAILPDGVFMLINNSPSRGVDLYDSHEYTFLGHVSLDPDAPVTVGCDNTNTFYVQVATGGNWHIRKISSNGTLSGTIYDLGNNISVAGIGANKAGTILYYYQSDIIKRWDLVNNVALPNLVSPSVHLNAGGFLVLQDDSIVYGNTSTGIVRYDGTTGALLNTYTPAHGLPMISGPMCTGVDATSFWQYQVTGSSPQYVVQYRVSDGVILQDTSWHVVSGGAGSAVYRWGPDATCPMWVTRVPFTPVMVSHTDPIRRMRRFSLPFQNNLLLFLRRLEFLIQSGVGLISGQGSDPVMMVRISGDGGMTWSQELSIGFGKMGEFTHRAILHQLGQASNFVVEVTVTDPVFVAFLDCFADLQEGAW